ncbi:glycosyl hydrolase family 95 catalytic domain-containing protein [Rhodopirellula sp. SWK7]|uniref:glycosyl hydrolase family 95 catalytic domain-containing protein n=1 Tax=Rhodopirellula sp. SWK7 TaxID=595460 RepID=UPI0002BE6E4F|nr:glycoside hydrolase N-terminal domain-containing protein [Rhodopirellula sp. SWK7]EMI41524.1 glycoside hydrolase family 95 [Rhodopirellula sp. SWK7]
MYAPLIAAIVLGTHGWAAPTDSPSQANPNKRVVCKTPALKWQDGMVTGNGLLGTLHHGVARDEIAVVNSHLFVTPNGAPFEIPDMSDQVAPMQALMLDGEIGLGYRGYHDELLIRRGLEVKRQNYYGMVQSQGFHSGYQIQTSLDGTGEVRDYRRSTEFQTGEIITRWTDDDGEWVRRSFASRAANVLVTEIVAPVNAPMSGSVALARVPKTPANVQIRFNASPNLISVSAKYNPVAGRQAGFEGVTRIALPDGGISVASGEIVSITNAPRVLLLTTLDRYRNEPQRWESGTLQKSIRQYPASYEDLLSPHVSIQREMFDRVEFNLHGDPNEREMDTSQLLAIEENDNDSVSLALVEKLFYTSRYLFMASSGSQYGPRLCGMFTGEWAAAWAGDYTCDANVNLAVLGGGIVNLPECMEGYFRVLERTKPQWQHAAERFWGCRGIVGPIRIDGEVAIPIHCGPYHAHFTATGLGPWLVYPMYEHYLITGDKEFLKQRVYPFLQEMALFYEDFLTHRDDDGKFIFVPSNSPENAWPGIQPRTSAAINSTMDIAAAKHCLTMLLDTRRILDIADDAESHKCRDMLDDMPPYLVNKDDALKEWSWPTIGENYSHRHSSHMYPVWPANEITPDNPETREFVPAVKKALLKRDHKVREAHDALQRAIAWIRLKDGEQFYRILKYLLENEYLYDSLTSSHNNGHDVYNYDAILCLQGLLTEMAVTTQPGVIEVLPAMPNAFRSGSIAGIKGRNQTTVEELKWNFDPASGHGTVELTINSSLDQRITVIHRNGIDSLTTTAKTTDSEFGTFAREVDLPANEPVQMTLRF